MSLMINNVIKIIIFEVIIGEIFTIKLLKQNDGMFPLSIIHVNDFHARFDEINPKGSPCSAEEKCIGGYARLVTIVKQLKKDRENAIYLNAGDNFQGTLWYNIGRWNVTSYFLNLLPPDAITLGNHEFDHGIEGVTPFMETIKSPMLVANIDAREEPSMQNKFINSIIISRSGRKIGIIGVTLETTPEVANSGKLKFLSDVKTVKKESEKLNQMGINIIIVLSHCGLERDRIIAKEGGPYIDIIVGGHSHSFLYSDEKLPGPDIPVDVYPIESIQESGRKVLIVQASCYTKYVGDIILYFDISGVVTQYKGSPIYLDANIKPGNYRKQQKVVLIKNERNMQFKVIFLDEQIVRELKPWKELIDAKGKEKVGKSRVTLSRLNCYYAECNIGNFLNDAFIHKYVENHNLSQNGWTSGAIAIMNAGGIRTTLDKGVLRFDQIVTAVPFENTVDSFDLFGKDLLNALEYSLNSTWQGNKFSSKNMLQISGLKVIYNISNPIGKRVVDIKVRCQKCNIPIYEPLKNEMMYKIICQGFLANGGDGFVIFRDKKMNHRVGPVDIDTIINYLKYQNPVIASNEGRISIIT